MQSETDPQQGKQQYQHDPHIDPQLQWAGKDERVSFDVQTVSLHVHENIDAQTVIRAAKKRNGAQPQQSLFTEERKVELSKAIEFYQHPHNWSNRLIAGDSLLVMNSLLQKEGMAGKVQCVYMDPPYGIKYGSNFQPFINKREVKDGKGEDLTAEPEMIKAFRDTWELGIHSYLSYLRDRLLLIRKLLTDSGSVFVQIGDENVHRVGVVLDDIFGAENRVATIPYATSGSSSSKTLPSVADYLLWYAKDKDKVKFRQLYESLTRPEIVALFTWHAAVELSDGTCRQLTDDERSDPDKFLPKGARLYRRMRLQSQGWSTTGRSENYGWNGREFVCPPAEQWRVSKEGLDHLASLNRLDAVSTAGAKLCWKRYENETPGRQINNVWAKQMSVSNKRYVVQTADSVLQRCILMTTDPGDLVFDPTCGSAVTAYNAEKWGRRWITCDTSRVATTIAKQRLITAVYDYYKLAYPQEGVGGGFEYKQVPYVSAAKLAYDEPQSFTTLYDQPLQDKKRVRVTGPFTVEAVPSPAVLPITEHQDDTPPPADQSIARSGETLRQSEWRDELYKSGIRGKSGQHISFSYVAPLPHPHLHAEAETKPDNAGENQLAENITAYNPSRAVIAFGPEHAPLNKRHVEDAIQQALEIVPKPNIVVFAAFQFDPEASRIIDDTKWQGVTLLKAQMDPDLQTGDLKKRRAANQSFWLIGQPDVTVAEITEGENKGKWQVNVHGFDYFNTKTGELESGGEKRIAAWLLDTDYNKRSLYPSQVFFPMSDPKTGWSRLAQALAAEIDAELIRAYNGTQSLPFELGDHRRIAVKIVDDRGIESLRVLEGF